MSGGASQRLRVRSAPADEEADCQCRAAEEEGQEAQQVKVVGSAWQAMGPTDPGESFFGKHFFELGTYAFQFGAGEDYRLFDGVVLRVE